MKIAFTTKGEKWESMIDPRFGRTEFILIYEEEKDAFISFDNRDIEQEAHGAGPKTSQVIYDLKPDVLITGNGPGGNAASILERMNIKIFTGAGNMTVKEAYEAYKKGTLKEF
ncbi:MAG: NifB/NifX family molybdenum-iron cluster-binding protein [Bacteroidales bacterium]|nr:NifB/NifX family molybdenum-iron cluster-binding protein [Bacteroidales bacterium]